MHWMTTAVVNSYHWDLRNKAALFSGRDKAVSKGLNVFSQKELIKI